MKLPLKWEFPGGKIEPGETKEQCLVREVREELGLDINVEKELSMVVHRYSEFGLYLYPFVCKLIGGDVLPTEHAQVIWVSIDELWNYDWAEADIPIVKEVIEIWS